MKALIIEAPQKAGYVDRPVPELRSNEVLLRLKRVGFCGSDLNTFRGTNPLISYPRIPGHEIAGEIVDWGSAVPNTFSKGQCVSVLPYTTCGKCSACRNGRVNACRHNQTLGVQRDGAFTEFFAIPWEHIITSPKLSELQWALVEPLSVGFHAVHRGRVESSDTVLIFGCGMIGLGAMVAAGKERGARVIAVDVDDAKLSLALRCGASHVVNSRHTSLEKMLLDLTHGEGADVVIEAVGLPQTFRAAVELAAFTGRVVYIGYAKEEVSYETKYFILKELDIMGSRNAVRSDFDRVIHFLESDRCPVDQMVTQTVAFDDAAEALAQWNRNPASVTKIHVTF